MDDVDLTTTILTRLHTLGVRLAIDDFGTGHSSLGYLARFPIDVVKIDQSFVRDIDRDPVKSAIVSAVVALSQAIGSTTVVEGVETPAQLEEVKNLGCDVAQGFYFARPVSAAAFGKLLTANTGAITTPPDLRIVGSRRTLGPGRVGEAPPLSRLRRRRGPRAARRRASASNGTTSCQSPTMPTSQCAKTGAPRSAFTARMVPADAHAHHVVELPAQARARRRGGARWTGP